MKKKSSSPNFSILPESHENLRIIIDQQAEEILGLKETIQLLKDEIAILKKQKPKPKIRPSKLGKKGKKAGPSGKRPGSVKKGKTAKLKINKFERCKPDSIPEGATFKGFREYTVQGFKITPFNVCYQLEQWVTPEGKTITGKLPPEVDGHFDHELKSFILYQYHHCHVTQPLLLEQLREWGVDISSGQLSNILTENNESFHDEKDAILPAGLHSSSHVNVDDTGARHDGKNGYCTHIGNKLFAWFESTNSKSRINFLELLRTGYTDYILNDDAFEYMLGQRLAKSTIAILKDAEVKEFSDEKRWKDHLKSLGIKRPRHIQIATEGALLGSLFAHGLPRCLVVVSDDAGQFNILRHALCWIHAERTLAKLHPPSEEKKQILDRIRKEIWDFYDELKVYKESPNDKDKVRLEKKFNMIFTQETDYCLLNNALKRLYANKEELLVVLDRPEIPLHNNLSENDIREYVKRRKVSGSTRSEAGRRSRDTFTSLKKTCRKLGISFWQYLKDRLSGKNTIPPIPDLILQANAAPG